MSGKFLFLQKQYNTYNNNNKKKNPYQKQICYVSITA